MEELILILRISAILVEFPLKLPFYRGTVFSVRSMPLLLGFYELDAKCSTWGSVCLKGSISLLVDFRGDGREGEFTFSYFRAGQKHPELQRMFWQDFYT